MLDQAEIPTVQERGLEPSRGAAPQARRGRARPRAHGDGRARRPAPARRAEAHLPARRRRTAAPLAWSSTLDAVVRDPARVDPPRRHLPRPDRLEGDRRGAGRPHRGPNAARRAGDPTDGLRTYPKDLLQSPLDQRDASFSVRPGDGTLIAPRAAGGHAETTAEPRSDGLTGLFEDAAAGRGVLVLLLLGALGWGALHALSPGHGKAMVAAYLVGTRGSARDAVVLGATVTVTHTIGVFALGLVTLSLSQYVLPERLYPWLTLVSGLMVVLVGAGVLRSRLRRSHSHGHHARPRPRTTRIRTRRAAS